LHEVVIRQIRDAFPTGTPPARPVTSHRCFECDEVDLLLGGRTWTEIASDFPTYCHDSFCLLTPEAKSYYLPSYLEHGLREPGWMSGHSAACALERGDLCRESFNPSQRAAILRWIETYYQDEPETRPPETVLNYWRDAAPE
jgi:hypothetical protein